MQHRSMHFFSQLTWLGLALLLALTVFSCRRSSSHGGGVFLAVSNNMTASAVSSTQVKITWTDEEFDGAFVEIERSTDQITYAQVVITETANTSYTDTVPAGDMIYYYRLRSRNNNEQGDASELSDYSNVAIAVTMAAPTGLSAAAISAKQIDLQWTDNSGLENGYAVERMKEGGAFVEIAQVPANTGLYIDTGVTGGNLYTYKVRAFNEGGNTSGYCPEFAVVSPITPWAKSYGGVGMESAGGLLLTSDKGYVIAGETQSYGQGSSDMWLLKAAMEGNIEWQWAIGGSQYDLCNAIAATPGGGYILAGKTESFGTGKQDMWVVKLSSSQRIDWEKAYGLADNDYARALIPVSSGGYLLAGDTENGGQYDVWVMKIDSSGNPLWVRTLGGSANDLVNGIVQTDTGAFVVLGSTRSFGAGFSDYWLCLINPDGTVEQNMAIAYGGLDFDWAQALIQTKDRGYLLAGETKSWGATGDAWLLKVNSWGEPQWQISLGGADSDKVNSIVQTKDKGFIAVGMTFSYGFQGSADAWVIKLDNSGNIEWQLAYGGPGADMATNVGQLIDNGYIITGQYDSGTAGTNSKDIWAIKVSQAGEIEFSSASGAVKSASQAVATPTMAKLNFFNPVLPDRVPMVVDSAGVIVATDCAAHSQVQ
ncbi:MAG: hypothetical protein ABIK28_04100 [Planctomycetota bacterium]